MDDAFLFTIGVGCGFAAAHLLGWLLACSHEGDCPCIGEWDDGN